MRVGLTASKRGMAGSTANRDPHGIAGIREF